MTVKKEGTQFLHWFGPLLDALRALGGSGTPDEATDKVAELCKVPESRQNELMESGQPRFRNQVAWARFYLKREGLLDSSTRGVWRLTDKGQATHLTYAQAQDIFRKQVKIDTAARKQKQKDHPSETDVDSPEELDLSIAADYRDRLLAAIQALPFAGFERLCQRLLREAGFQQVAVTGRSGDNGIGGHGILELNAFVTFKVLFANATRAVSGHHRSEISAAPWRDARTRASFLPQAPLLRRPGERPDGTEHAPSSSWMATSLSTCSKNWNLG